jgi:hypothetical protein
LPLFGAFFLAREAFGELALRLGGGGAVLDFIFRVFLALEEVTFGISRFDQTLILSVGK